MNSKKLGYVDAIRGIAILMVILVHTAQRIPNLSYIMDILAQYGQMGVQLFFVASAYTLCISFEGRAKEPYKILSFYIRRWFRIAPLYYLAILIYFSVLIGLQLYAGNKIISTGQYSFFNVLANVVFVHGFVPSANNNIVPGGWSIGTEMAFYLIFPLVFAVSKKIYGGSVLHLLWLLIACLVVNLTIQTILTGVTHQSIRNNDFRYFNIINQLPVFILGVIAYFLHKNGTYSRMPSRMISILGFIFFSGIALLLLKARGQLVPVIIPTVSGVSFLFLLNWFKIAGHQSRLLCKIGVVSYSMYIFHFIFAWVLLPIIFRNISHPFNPDIELVIAFIFVSTLTYLVARFTQRFIEAKFTLAGAKLILRLQARK